MPLSGAVRCIAALVALNALDTLVAGRGVAPEIIGVSEKICDLRDVQSGWVSSNFNLDGCIILNGSSHKVSDSDAKVLADELIQSSTLKSLLLEDSQLSDTAVVSLAKALASHDSLLVLNLAGNDITTAAADALVTLIETNSKLAILNLQRNKLMSEGVKKVLSCIEDNKGLIELSLNENGDDVGHSPEENTNEGAVARSFSGLLHERTNLKVLRIGNTGINRQGTQLIMDALAKNDHLEEFEIGFNAIGPAGGELIGEALMENKALKRLIIDGSDVADDGAAEISHALKFNTVIEELSLKSNSLTDEGARYFADVLEEIDWTGLKKLQLGYRDHKIRGEWYHYIQRLLEIHHSRTERDILLKTERRRICLLVKTNDLDIPCDLLIDAGFRRVGDLLLLTATDCENKLERSEELCESIKQLAQAVEKPLPGHIEL